MNEKKQISHEEEFQIIHVNTPFSRSKTSPPFKCVLFIVSDFFPKSTMWEDLEAREINVQWRNLKNTTLNQVTQLNINSHKSC